MSPWTIVAVVASVGKSYATYQQGMGMKAYYDAKADVAKLQYKSKEIEAKDVAQTVLLVRVLYCAQYNSVRS